jgi:hypothetical protein
MDLRAIMRSYSKLDGLLKGRATMFSCLSLASSTAQGKHTCLPGHGPSA